MSEWDKGHRFASSKLGFSIKFNYWYIAFFFIGKGICVGRDMQMGDFDFTFSYFPNVSYSRYLVLLHIHSASHYYCCFKHFSFIVQDFFSFVEKWEGANKQKEDNTFHPSIQHRVLGIEAINKYLLIECQELAPWPLGKLLKLSYSICKKGWLAGLLCYLFPYVIDLFDISHLSGTWWKVLNKSYLYYYLWGRNYLKFAVSKYLTAVCHKKENDLFAI